MSIINPFTGHEISLDSRRYRDVKNTDVLDMSIHLPIECKEPSPTKGLENKEGTLSRYLKNGTCLF